MLVVSFLAGAVAVGAWAFLSPNSFNAVLNYGNSVYEKVKGWFVK